MKKYTGLTNKELGEMFGVMSYSAIAKAHERFCALLTRDRFLRKEVQRIPGRMSNVKG